MVEREGRFCDSCGHCGAKRVADIALYRSDANEWRSRRVVAPQHLYGFDFAFFAGGHSVAVGFHKSHSPYGNACTIQRVGEQRRGIIFGIVTDRH